MDSKVISQIIIVGLVMGGGITIPVLISWFDHRTRTRGLDTLRIYAERGQEPPASVIEAVRTVTDTWGYSTRPRAATPQTRGNHLAHAAASTVIAVGLAGLVWWRVSAYDEKGVGIIVGILAALFFAGSVAARLVYAYYTPNK